MHVRHFAAILIFLFTSQILAQEPGQSSVPATLRLRSDKDLESAFDLSPGSAPRPIGDNLYGFRLRPRDAGLMRWLGLDISVPRGNVVQRRAGVPLFLSGLKANPDPFIQEMTGAVSRDSLSAVILGLQSIGTRYEYAPGQDSAAFRIYDQFQRWGLEVAYDSFALGTATVYDLDYISPDTGWICGTGGLMARTTDGGSSWTNQGSGFTYSFYGMEFVSPAEGWTVSDNGRILRSMDGGATWASQSSPVTSTLYDVAFADSERGLAVGVSGKILLTTDGGTNWTSVTSGTTNTLRKIAFVDPLRAWVVGGVPGSSATILHSTDGGVTWLPQTPPAGSYYLRGVCFIDSVNGWSSGDGPTILKTTNGGVDWLPKNSPPGTGTILRGVSFLDQLEGWIADYYGQLLHTTDGGDSWSISYAPAEAPYFVDLCAFSHDRITLVGTASTVITSTDGGSGWISQSSNLPAQFFHMTQNVVATLPGLVTPEKECVIVAHYDSYSNNPYVSAPGANDNGTGTAAVMEAARICREYQFGSTIKFLAVSAEELGLHGSKHYASAAQAEGRIITGVVNGDMLGYPSTSDSTRLVIGSYLSYNRLIDSAIAYNTRYGLGLNLVAGVDYSGASDHAPFTTAGFDALDVAEATAEEIWGGSDPYYHKTTDTFDKLNMGMVWNGARLMLATLAEMARPTGKTGGGEPIFSKTPASIAFGDLRLGQSKTDSVTVTNQGTDTLVIQTLISDAPEFSVVPASGTIPPGGSRKFYATFTPIGIGPKSGNGIFSHNAAGSPDTVGFTGLSFSDPVISISPLSLDFGEVEMGSSRSDSIRVSNSGEGILVIGPVGSDDPDFLVSAPEDTILPGENRSYTITFRPTGTGPREGNALIAHNADGSPDTVHLSGIGTGSALLMNGSMLGGWNIVSAPLIAGDMRTTLLFPAAVSNAFGYDGTLVPRDTLIPRKGYWLKFASPSPVSMAGYEQLSGTLEVGPGWNMIGSLSAPFPVQSVASDPGGLVTSQFFGYEYGYTTVDTLEPWKGYWVKVNEPGTLILSGAAAPEKKIRILEIKDRPPFPPEEVLSGVSDIPSAYGLGEAYPNPFNPTTTIGYNLPSDSRVNLQVFTVFGQVVATLVDGVQPAGYRTATWNATGAASGIYFYRVEAHSLPDRTKSFRQVKKTVLLK